MENLHIENYRIAKGSGKKGNYVSYGETKGTFKIPPEKIPIYIRDKIFCQKVALVEIKTEYYRLMFDLDYKPRNEKNEKYYKLYEGREEELTTYIIDKIMIVLDDVFIEPNKKYIYCDKNIGEGIHLYYPNIIVNKIIHTEIAERIFSKILEENKYEIEKYVWENIIDTSVSKGNGMRLPYCEYNGKYYKPNYEKSSLDIPKNISEQIKYFQINTEETKHSPELKITINIEKVMNKINKKEKIIEKVENEDLQVEKYIDLSGSKEMVLELLDMLNQERIEKYDTWIEIIYFCKNYGLYEESIKISKKSKKFDYNAKKIIDDIFKIKYIPKQYLSIGTLIKWCKDDDNEKCKNICYRYDLKLKLDIKKTDDYFIRGIKYDIIENNKYITRLEEIYKGIKEGVRTIILHSPTGSGKTTSIEKIIEYFNKECLIKEANNESSILSIVSRRSMCGTHINAFKNLGLESYLNSFDFVPKYITSVEHLKYLGNRKYNIIILDEINSLLSYYYSNTLDNRRLICFQNLCKLMLHADLVICCDSNVTNIVHKFIDNQRKIFGKVIKYRNINKNKENVTMNIYQSKNKNETGKIIEFCKLMENEIKNSNSVLILSDSKKITIKVKEALQKYNNNDEYYRLVNREYGSVEEIVNCNEEYLNKCVITSPKILYGVDITIPYEKIYCIYKYTGTTNSINSMEYHQQYSRARVCKVVNILDLNPEYEKNQNYDIPFDAHIKEEDNEYNKTDIAHNEICKKYKVINELCNEMDIDGLKINKRSLFADIHYYKTWYDKLFNNNKMQLVYKLAEEAGYKINMKELIITGMEDISEVNKSIKKYETLIKDLTDSIVENEENKQNDERIMINLIETVKTRMKFFGVYNVEDLHEDVKKCVKDPKEYNTYINKKYLDMTKEKYDTIKIKIINNEIPQLAQDNRIIKKIDTLEGIEKIVGIKRYQIKDINQDIDIKNVKEKLIKNNKEIINLMEGIASEKRLLTNIDKKIQSITSYNKLQKFVADCYNSFGNVIEYKKKREMYNKKKITMYVFN